MDILPNLDRFLIPGPDYSTIRFDPSVSCFEEVVQFLQKKIYEDFTQVHHQETIVGNPSEVIIEKHSLIHDVAIISHQSIRNLLTKLTTGNHLRSKVCLDNREIIVDKKCGISVLRGSHIYVPGILSASPGIYKNCVVNVFVDIERKCLKGSKSFEGSKFFIGKGISMYNRKQIFSSNIDITNGIGVEMISPINVAPSLSNSTLPKSCFAQNFPSVIATHVLAPMEGSIVLDMCAAPGGKTTHLCSFMNHKGTVVALDKSKSRADKIKENTQLLGYADMVKIFAVDSRDVINENVPNTNNLSPPFNTETFPFILLDAPCSGLGQRPRFTNDIKNEKELNSFPPMQRQLFETAVKLLTPGGSLVYCTCTTAYDENEKIVEWALDKFQECLELSEQTPCLGSPGRSGCTNLTDLQLSKLQYFPMPNSSLIISEPKYHPIDRDTIGFFIARFKKTQVKFK